jgi:hypothetical protein
MPTSLARLERFAAYLDMVVAHNRVEVSRWAPKQFLVAEYDSGDLNWIYTADSLAECAALINAGSVRDTSVFDLDTGREHRVVYTASIEAYGFVSERKVDTSTP